MASSDRLFETAKREGTSSSALKTHARKNAKPSFSERQESGGVFGAFRGALDDFVKMTQGSDFAVAARGVEQSFQEHRERNVESSREAEKKTREFWHGPDAPAASTGQTVANKATEQLEKNLAQQSATIASELVATEKSRSDLTPTELVEADRRRDALTSQLRDLHVQHAEMSIAKRMSDTAVRDSEERLFGKGGLLPGASSADLKALTNVLEGDFTPEEMQAVTDEIMNSNFGDQEKLDRLGFVVDNVEVQKELMIALDDVVASRRELEILTNSTDKRLLGNDYVTNLPQFQTQMEIDTAGRFSSSMSDSLDALWEVQTGMGMPPDIVGLVLPLMELIVQDPAYAETPQFQIELQELALKSGNKDITATGIGDAIVRGLELGKHREESWTSALDQEIYEPGSDALRYALFQMALADPTVGGDENLANIIASSKDMHLIINATSGGAIGGPVRGGSKMGIGGLTAAAYERLGFPVNETIGDPAAEFAAFIAYIMEWGGPAAATRGFLETGMWGE